MDTLRTVQSVQSKLGSSNVRIAAAAGAILGAMEVCGDVVCRSDGNERGLVAPCPSVIPGSPLGVVASIVGFRMRDVPVVAFEGALQAVINNDADHVLQAKMQESSALVANARNFQEVVGTDGSTYYVNTATQETIVEKPRPGGNHGGDGRCRGAAA